MTGTGSTVAEHRTEGGGRDRNLRFEIRFGGFRGHGDRTWVGEGEADDGDEGARLFGERLMMRTTYIFVGKSDFKLSGNSADAGIGIGVAVTITVTRGRRTGNWCLLRMPSTSRRFRVHGEEVLDNPAGGMRGWG